MNKEDRIQKAKKIIEKQDEDIEKLTKQLNIYLKSAANRRAKKD